MRSTISIRIKKQPILTGISLLIAVYCVIWLINPISSNIYALGGCILAWYIIATVIDSRTILYLLFSRKTAWIWVWPLVMTLYSLFGHMEFSLSYFVYILIGFIAPYYILTDKEFCLRIITLVGIGYCIIICIMSNIVYKVYPSISRVLSYGSDDMINSQWGLSYKTPFIAAYKNIYILIFLVLIIMGGLKHVKIKRVRVILVLIGLLFVYTIIKAQFTIALMLLIIGIVGYFAYNQTNVTRKVALYILTALMGLIGLLFLQSILTFFADLLGGNIAMHLRDLIGTLNGSRGVLTADRIRVYLISFETIFEHPIFGAGTLDQMYVSVGFHSSLLDAFARFGIFGAIPYLATITIPYKMNLRCMRQEYQLVYKWIFILFLISSLFNVMFNYQTLCTIYILIPGAVCLLDKYSNKDEQLQE